MGQVEVADSSWEAVGVWKARWRVERVLAKGWVLGGCSAVVVVDMF